MLEIIVGIFEQGLIYGIMAFGVYISYSILDFPDLSVDGTFPMGAAVCIALMLGGVNPWLCLLIAFLAGCAAGAFTGVLNVHLRIRNLLAGILTMTALYSVNYRIAGTSTVFLPMDADTIFSQAGSFLPQGLVDYRNIIVIVLIAIAAKLLLDWYLRTKSGFLLKCAGTNEGLVVTLAQKPGRIKIIGLALSNGLVALAGAVNCQYTRQFYVGSGTGTVVMGLAAVIIGTTVFRKLKFMRITTGVLLGMVVYKACTYFALGSGLRTTDTNLVITALFILTLVLNEFVLKKKKAGVKKDA